MPFILIILAIILIIGAFKGGNSFGETVRKGSSGLFKAIIIIVIILTILISYLNK